LALVVGWACTGCDDCAAACSSSVELEVSPPPDRPVHWSIIEASGDVFDITCPPDPQPADGECSGPGRLWYHYSTSRYPFPPATVTVRAEDRLWSVTAKLEPKVVTSGEICGQRCGHGHFVIER
jgi:hypothetical protein